MSKAFAILIVLALLIATLGYAVFYRPGCRVGTFREAGGERYACVAVNEWKAAE